MRPVLKNTLLASPKDISSILSSKAALLIKVGSVHLVEWKVLWTRS